MSNIEKEILTKENIVRDIKNSLKKPAKMSGSSYKTLSVIAAIIAVLTVITEFFFLYTERIDPKLAGLIFLPACISIIIFGAFEYLVLLYKRINFRIEDYEVKTEILSHRSDEKHSEWVNQHHKREVSIFTLHFENKEKFRIPQDNFTWSPLRQMSDFSLFNLSHRGDEFIIVVKKKSGKIAMVYPKVYFEYKE